MSELREDVYGKYIRADYISAARAIGFMLEVAEEAELDMALIAYPSGQRGTYDSYQAFVDSLTADIVCKLSDMADQYERQREYISAKDCLEAALAADYGNLDISSKLHDTVMLGQSYYLEQAEIARVNEDYIDEKHFVNHRFSHAANRHRNIRIFSI